MEKGIFLNIRARFSFADKRRDIVEFSRSWIRVSEISQVIECPKESDHGCLLIKLGVNGEEKGFDCQQSFDFVTGELQK